VKAGALEKHGGKILANVVQIAAHCANDDCAYGPGACINKTWPEHF
jgi:hypothetical protein